MGSFITDAALGLEIRNLSICKVRSTLGVES